MSENTLAAAPEPAGGASAQRGPRLAARVDAEHDAHLKYSLAGYVSAKGDAQVNISAAGIIAAGRDIRLAECLGQVIASGFDLHMEDSAALLVKPGKNATLNHAGSVVFVGQQANVRNSRIGLALARELHLTEGSRVLFSTPQALAFGAAFGAVCAILGWLLHRRQGHNILYE